MLSQCDGSFYWGGFRVLGAQFRCLPVGNRRLGVIGRQRSYERNSNCYHLLWYFPLVVGNGVRWVVGEVNNDICYSDTNEWFLSVYECAYNNKVLVKCRYSLDSCLNLSATLWILPINREALLYSVWLCNIYSVWLYNRLILGLA